MVAAGTRGSGPISQQKQRVEDADAAGVPTCTSCGYDMTGSDGKRCPECGKLPGIYRLYVAPLLQPVTRSLARIECIVALRLD